MGFWDKILIFLALLVVGIAAFETAMAAEKTPSAILNIITILAMADVMWKVRKI